jgi:hypothetical protein
MMDSAYVFILLAGFGGGLVRGFAGFMKHQLRFKDVKFNPVYFFGMVALSGIIGVLTALATKGAGSDLLGSITLTPAVAFIVGYAGGDFLESAYKILFGKGSLS